MRLYELSRGDEFYVSQDSQYSAPKQSRLKKLDRKGGRCLEVDTGKEHVIPTMAFVELATPTDPQAFSVRLNEEVEELLNETFDEEPE